MEEYNGIRMNVYLTDNPRKRKKAVTRALEIQEKKTELFAQRLMSKEREFKLRERERAREDDPDWAFLKSILPQLKKAKDSFTLKMKIMETIKNYLDVETLMSSDLIMDS